MTAPWLTVVGMGEDGLSGLAPPARRALEEADLVVGSRRLLALAPGMGKRQLEWPSPFDPMIDELLSCRGERVVVLASGDPLNYGVARKILARVPIAEVRVIPGVSALSLAAARMGWSLPDTDTFTLHGRAASTIEPFIQPGARLIALADGDESVREAARRLVARGFGKSRITVLEAMGGTAERRLEFAADEVPEAPFAELLTIAVECRAGPDALVRPRLPGLADEAFAHDGQITKREVRAVTLAALAPAPDELLWDVGAGSGSVAIEWMRAVRGTRAIAFEREPDRLALIARNADRLGTPLLDVVAGEAPASFEGRPAPHAIFLGGAVADDAVFAAAWSALRPGGRLVANAVTLEGEARLIDRQARHGGDLVRIAVEELATIGGRRALKPRMAVLQWRVVKP
jgi:precorrin-6Y C5,15-methyltransferase (decarboxylating)